MGRMLIRKSGILKDAQDCDGNELVFSSEFNTLKDYLHPAVQTRANASGTLQVYTVCNHGLGYVPTFKVYYDNNDGVWHDATSALVDFSGPAYNNTFSYADADNIYFQCFPGTYKVKVFVFKNKGSQ